MTPTVTPAMMDRERKIERERKTEREKERERERKKEREIKKEREKERERERSPDPQFYHSDFLVLSPFRIFLDFVSFELKNESLA